MKGEGKRRARIGFLVSGLRTDFWHRGSGGQRNKVTGELGNLVRKQRKKRVSQMESLILFRINKTVGKSCLNAYLSAVFGTRQKSECNTLSFPPKRMKTMRCAKRQLRKGEQTAKSDS
jgi:hypothetical protein